jgi:drug/metabolite transporter (DMT)-like permease
MNRGFLMLVLAELCFAVTTVFVKWVSTAGGADIPAVEITFFRFFFGVFIAYAALKQTGTSFKPNNVKLVIMRGLLNTVALICFFISVKYTTLTNANMLNMTYPVFIFLFSFLILRHKVKKMQWIYLAISTVGIYMVIQPNFGHILFGDIIGLVSGFSGGLAIMTLRQARKYDTTALILFYLMLIGTFVNGIILIPMFVQPTPMQWVYIIASALLGVAGQALLTSGYKHIDARRGGIISSSRIVFAATLGIFIFNERLNLELVVGGLLIMVALISLALGEKTKANT